MGISTLSELLDAIRMLRGITDPHALAFGLRESLADKGGALARAYEGDAPGEDHVFLAVVDDSEDDLFAYALPDSLVRDGGWEPLFDAVDGAVLGRAPEAKVEAWAAYMRLAAAAAMFEDVEALELELGEVGREYFDRHPSLPTREQLASVDGVFLPHFGATTIGGPDPSRLDRRYRRVVSFRRAY